MGGLKHLQFANKKIKTVISTNKTHLSSDRISAESTFVKTQCRVGELLGHALLTLAIDLPAICRLPTGSKM